MPAWVEEVVSRYLDDPKRVQIATDDEVQLEHGLVVVQHVTIKRPQPSISRFVDEAIQQESSESDMLIGILNEQRHLGAVQRIGVEANRHNWSVWCRIRDSGQGDALHLVYRREPFSLARSAHDGCTQEPAAPESPERAAGTGQSGDEHPPSIAAGPRRVARQSAEPERSWIPSGFLHLTCPAFSLDSWTLRWRLRDANTWVKLANSREHFRET